MRRRTFLQAAAAAPSIASSTSRVVALDYGRSFVSGVAEWNRVRFWVESRTRIIDERSGRHEDFIQCGACKSENTFAKKDLMKKENYDFIPVFGQETGVLFRRMASLNKNYRQILKTSDMWGGQKYQLHEAKEAELLESSAAVRSATHEGWPLVAQTEIRDQGAGLRAILEYPVKTINILDSNDVYQVDTGPLAFPDLSRRYERRAESLSLAFVAFNVPHFADFVIEDATPIVEHGKEMARVWHYSRLLSLPAVNRLYVCKG